ncbi:AAEL008881-PA [Aedes aegypti]|uniref:AAEL008881-PA n=1 Tax=Aedes aegypti TaxID=7159 RepID=Q16XH2_AEDAE|nr:AAEL008881-PA [Aedes aegypti]
MVSNFGFLFHNTVAAYLYDCNETKLKIQGFGPNCSICKDLTVDLHQKQEQIFDMEKELIIARKEREAAVKEAEHCRNVQNSVQMEYELYQQRAKSRENELIESLQEARGGTTPKADVQKILETTRQELKQLEVHNYELQRQLERQTEELEKLKKTEHDHSEKLIKMKEALDKDVNRKDAKKLFRLVNKLRAILADEDLLLINTSIDTDEFADSLGDSSFNSDSLDRMSPSKIVLTNDTGNTNVIYKNGNSQLLDMTIENGELKKQLKLLEDENKNMNALLKKYENEIEKLNKTDSHMKELVKQLEEEQSKSKSLHDVLQSKKEEFEKLTVEYDELSTQVMDNIQDIDNYKEQIEHLQKKLQEASNTIESYKNTETELQLLHEKNKATENQLSEAHMRIIQLQEENETLLPFKAKFEESTQQVAQLESVSEQLEQLKAEYEVLKARNEALEEAKKELESKLCSMEESQEKHGQLQTHFEEQHLKLKQLQEENHDLTVAVQELSAKIVSLEEQMVREDNSGVELVSENIKAKLESSLELIKEERDHLSEALPNLEEIERKVQDLEQENDDLRKQIDGLQTDQNEWDGKFVALQTDKENAMRSLEKDLNELNDRYASLQDAKQKQEETLQLLSDNVSALEEEKCVLLQQIEAFKDEKANNEVAINGSLELEIKLQQSLEELSALKEEKAILEQRIESHKLEQQSIEDKCESLCNELSQMITVKDQANEAERQLLMNENNNLRSELQEKDEALNGQINALKSELTDVGEQKSKLLAKLQSLENEMEESSSIREHLEREVRALKTDLGNLQQQLTENNGKLEQFQKENDSFQHELKCKTDEVEQLEEKLTAALKESVERVGRTESEWVEKLRNVESCNGELKIKSDALETEKNGLLEEVVAVKGECESLRELIKQKEVELETISHQVSRLEKQLAETELRNVECESRRTEVEKLRDTLELEIKQFKKEIEKKAEEVINLEEKLAAAKLNGDQIVEVEKEWAEKHKHMEACNEEQRHKLGALERENELQRKQLEEAVAEQESLSKELNEKDCQLKEVQCQIESLKNQITELKTENDRCTKAETASNENLKVEKQHSNELRTQIDELERVKDALTSELRTVQQKFDCLTDIHTDILQEKSLVDKQIIQLEAQLANVRAELVIRDDKLSSFGKLLLENKSEIDQLNEKLKSESTTRGQMAEQHDSEMRKVREELVAEKSKVLDYCNNQVSEQYFYGVTRRGKIILLD